MSYLEDPHQAGQTPPEEDQAVEPAEVPAAEQPAEEENAEASAEPTVEEAAPETGAEQPPAEAPAAETAVELPAVEQVSPGDVLKGVIRRVDDELVVVDVGYKADGVVPRSELTLGPGQRPQDLFEEGQVLYVSVLSVDPRDGGLLLSERRARAERAWIDLEEAMAEGRILKAPVVEAVKGGLIVDVGLRAFMPASHVERGYVNDLNRYVGQTVRARVIEMDRTKSRVILSQKVVLDEEHEKRRQETWATLEAGQTRTGVVKGLTDFGAFIDLGGVDGLLHVSELAWGRVERPSDVLQEGQEITVKVLKVDHERERVSLSLKQTLPDPWEGAAARYPEGSWVTGRVVRLAPFGAFVELEPGIEGLVHISEMAERHVAKPDDVVQPGEEVQCRILRVQEGERRISLSLKPEPQRRIDLPGVERGEPDAQQRRGGGKRRGRERRRGAERERIRVDLGDREPEGITLGEMFGDLFQQTREMLVNEQRARGEYVEDDDPEEPEAPTGPAGDEEAAATQVDAVETQAPAGSGESPEPSQPDEESPGAAGEAGGDSGDDAEEDETGENGDETKPS